MREPLKSCKTLQALQNTVPGAGYEMFCTCRIVLGKKNLPQETESALQ
jgi:hypothetical protein